MQSVIPRILNVVVVILSVYFTGIVIFYIYASFTPGTVIVTAKKPSLIGILPSLIMLGSIAYYLKSDQLIMKIISSVGCISMLIFLIITYL